MANHPLGYKKPDNIATDWDKKIIDAVSLALDGEVGGADDIDRLRKQIENGPLDDNLHTACEIAVAFIRWSQDLKNENENQRMAGYL